MIRIRRRGASGLLGALCVTAFLCSGSTAFATSPAQAPAATPPSAAAGPTRFLANWSGKGQVDPLPFGKGRTVATFRQTGTLTTLRQGLVGNALTKCVGLEDGHSNDHAYCVWIDANGNEIRVELTGDLGGTRDTGTGFGTFVGGSGPFVHLKGTFQFEWVLLPTSKPGTFQFKTVQMAGSYQAGSN